MDCSSDKPHAQFANKAHENLNVTPHINGSFANFFGEPLRARTITGCFGWEIGTFISEQLGKLGSKPIDLQISPCFALQMAEVNHQGDPRAIAVVDARRIDDDAFRLCPCDGRCGAAPYLTCGGRVETTGDG